MKNKLIKNTKSLALGIIGITSIALLASNCAPAPVVVAPKPLPKPMPKPPIYYPGPVIKKPVVVVPHNPGIKKPVVIVKPKPRPIVVTPRPRPIVKKPIVVTPRPRPVVKKPVIVKPLPGRQPVRIIKR